MDDLLRAARALGLDVCPSLHRPPGIVGGVLFYRPTTRTATARQIARILATHLATNF